MNLFMGGQVSTTLAGKRVTLRQAGDYPWNGSIKFTVGVQGPQDFALRIRVPGWANRADFLVKGGKASPCIANGYAEFRRVWSNGDTVEMTLPMGVERLEANPQVVFDQGKMAVWLNSAP